MDKKVGLKRIDAAYDALLPLGFLRSQIKSAIDSLKKVYGGKNSMGVHRRRLLASYRILIDTLLEEQKDKGKEAAASQGNELVAWEGTTEHGESSSREQHGSSTQTYLPLDYDYTPRLQPCACAAGVKRKSCDDSDGDDHSGGSAHQERKGCGGWLSDED